MNVANILPGDDVLVELRYNELLVPTDGRYQFVYPTVVGPRYAGTASNAPSETTSGSTPAHAQAFPAQPVLREGEVSPSAFNLKVNLASPIGIQDIRSPSHAIDTAMDAGSAAKRASVQLAGAASRVSNNRDFILDYRLAGNAIQSGVLLHRGEKENFFLAMVQPPQAVPQAAITPRDYVFVVDISGSMHGFPLDTAKALMRQLLGNLRASDTFNVLLFSGSNRMLAPHSVPATPANVNAAIRTIEQMGGGGSTELLPALRRVYAEPKAPELARTVVVVTDGYVTVESEAFALVRQHLGQANVFAFGIGSSVNRHLMEGLARAGMGEPFIVTRPDEAKAQAERFRKLIESPVLTSVTARCEGIDVVGAVHRGRDAVVHERVQFVGGLFGEHQDRCGDSRVAELHSLVGEADAQPGGTRLDRSARNRYRPVSVGVGLDHCPHFRGPGDAAQCAHVVSIGAEVDLGPGPARGFLSRHDATTPRRMSPATTVPSTASMARAWTYAAAAAACTGRAPRARNAATIPVRTSPDPAVARRASPSAMR